MADRLCGDIEAHGEHAWQADTVEWCPGRCDNEPCQLCDDLTDTRRA